MFSWFGKVSYCPHTKVGAFADHLKDGRIMASRCTKCGFTSFPPRGPPVAQTVIEAPSFPQACVLSGLPQGRYFVLAVLNVDARDPAPGRLRQQPLRGLPGLLPEPGRERRPGPDLERRRPHLE